MFEELFSFIVYNNSKYMAYRDSYIYYLGCYDINYKFRKHHYNGCFKCFKSFNELDNYLSNEDTFKNLYIIYKQKKDFKEKIERELCE